jgi:tetratricopeptide (TPR) repeat protein
MAKSGIVAWKGPLRRLLLAGLAVVAVIVVAAAYARHADARDLVRPNPGDVVYERPRGAVRPRPAEVRRDAPGAAAELATRFLHEFRTEGDPRALGRAQAALAPWWEDANAPSEIITLRATVKQSVHDFDAALADLNLVLDRDPSEAQARLVRATVLTVLARYDEATRDCRALAGLVSPRIVLVCEGAVLSVTGRANDAVTRVQNARISSLAGEERAWALSSLAEFQLRAGDVPAALAGFREALRLDPSDAYTRGALADALLYEGRGSEALALTKDDRGLDAVLLRHALAANVERTADADHLTDMLRQRFEASRLRGDAVHEREEARFYLELAHEPTHAAALARHNFTVQREPADVLILARAACAAGDAEGIRTARAFVDAHRLEDPFVARALAACPGGSR